MAGRLLRWAVLAVVFIAIARTIDLPRYWAFTAIWLGIALYGLLAADPGLLKERMKPAGPTIDRQALRAIRLLAVTSVVVALVDIDRFHWSDTVPPPVSLVALALFAASALLAARAMITNRFFSVAVRLQTDRGQHVVSDGPYRMVRHPGYLGMVVALPASALAIGSWWALLPALAYSALIVRRARMEDRYLTDHLDGYAEFARRVRFRLMPGVW